MPGVLDPSGRAILSHSKSATVRNAGSGLHAELETDDVEVPKGAGDALGVGGPVEGSRSA